MRFGHLFRIFSKGSPSQDKRIMFPIALIVLLLFASMFMQALHEDKIVKAVNQEVENRTFSLTYPLENDIKDLIRTFRNNPIIYEIEYAESKEFGVYFIQYVLEDYWQHERLKEQFKSYSDDIQFGDQKMQIETSLLVKFSEQIRFFLVCTMALGLMMVVSICFKIVKDKWQEVKVYHFLGFHQLNLSLLLTWYLLLSIGPGVFWGLVMFYGFYSFL